jgi:predicted ATPase/DNA-binding XRE family transcriptional regulator
MQQDHAADSTSFADLLRGHRLAAGLTQQELAERSGISVQAVSALERGWRRSPHRDTISLLASCLRLDEADRAAFAAAARRPLVQPRGRAEPELQPRLPVASGLLVGRQEELAAGRQMLLGSDLRLLTLTGPPGVGKTRLATALAQWLAPEFADGVSFISLAPLTDVGLVVTTIGRSLGIRDEQQPTTADQLCARIGDRRMLLLLDNFEHLLGAAPLLGDLLARCPRLRFLATSRSALRLRDEQELPVPPLPLAESVALFAQRAGARSHRFQLTAATEGVVSEICRRLDGLPLALELAAAWTKLLEPEALLERLDDRMEMLVGGGRDLPERQRTMRRTLEWSYDLLEPEERLLFQRLSVFRGGASLEAVDFVWRACSSDDTALHLVAALADKNLLVREAGPEPRVALLETVREFAVDLLAAAGSTEAAARAHADFYTALVDASESEVGRRQREVWLQRMETELPNLRAVMGWAAETGRAELGLRLAGRLQRVWENGHLREGIGWLDGWLASSVSPTVRAVALQTRTILAFRLGDLAAAGRFGHAHLELCRSLGDPAGVASALNYLAGIEWEQGCIDGAVELCEESLAIRRSLDDPADVACSLSNLALLLLERADQRAKAMTEEAVRMHRHVDDRGGLARSMGVLIEVAMSEGRLDQAQTLLDECLAQLGSSRDAEVRAYVLHLCGRLARARRDLCGAAARYREALRLRLEVGNSTRATAELEGLAAVLWMSGEAERSARLFGAATAVRAAAGGQVERSERESRESILAQLRAALGSERFDGEWSAGQAMSLAEAGAEALRE